MFSPALVRLPLYVFFLATPVLTAGPIGRRLGGLSPKQNFTLTVEDRQSFETKGKNTVQVFSIPAGIPDFKVGQKVKFTIGKKGQLQGPGFSLLFEQGYRGYNQYLSEPTRGNPTPDNSILTKTSSGKVRQVALYFYDKKSRSKSYSVTYLLK